MIGAPGADHPRIRGEHVFRSGPFPSLYGSSPHTRGALGEDNARDYPGWIIPAYAGSTRMPGTCPKPRGDHPRIRGEHGVEEELDIVVQGSSPHTRGARGAPPDVAAVLRIIPAYAGSTGPAGTPPSETPDHPRIRGEHNVSAVPSETPSGSSPHTRGARPLAPPRHEGCGDHPRIRGEHASKRRSNYRNPGSSPHTRGARYSSSRWSIRRGIIPAYAGSTGPSARTRSGAGDHPRIRGEHVAGLGSIGVCAGSSPHTRGAPLRV